MSGAFGEPIDVCNLDLYGSLTYVVISNDASCSSLNRSMAACWTSLMPSFCNVHKCRSAPEEPSDPVSPGPEVPQAAVVSSSARTAAPMVLRLLDAIAISKPLTENFRKLSGCVALVNRP